MIPFCETSTDVNTALQTFGAALVRVASPEEVKAALSPTLKAVICAQGPGAPLFSDIFSVFQTFEDGHTTADGSRFQREWNELLGAVHGFEEDRCIQLFCNFLQRARAHAAELTGCTPGHGVVLGSIPTANGEKPDQEKHADGVLTAKILLDLAAGKRPSCSMLLPVQEGTRLLIWPGSHTALAALFDNETPPAIHGVVAEIPLGYMLLFRLDFLHAGMGYSAAHIRGHAFLDSPDFPTWRDSSATELARFYEGSETVFLPPL